MKTRTEKLKNVIKEQTDGKKPAVLAVLSLPIAIGSLVYLTGATIYEGGHSLTKMTGSLIKNLRNQQDGKEKKSNQEVSGPVKRISSDDFEGTVELTQEVNINSDKLFEDIMISTDSSELLENTNEKEVLFEEETNEEGLNEGIHAHVQSLKLRDEKPLIDKDVIEEKEKEKARLEALKAKMIHETSSNVNSNSFLSKNEKLDILENLGYVSPTRGRFEEDSETTVEQRLGFTEELILENISPVEDIEEHEELISNIYADFLVEEDFYPSSTQEFDKMTDEEVETTIEVTLNLTSETPLKETVTKVVEPKEIENYVVEISEETTEETFDEEYEPTIEKLLETPVAIETEEQSEEIFIEQKEVEEEIDETTWCEIYKVPSLTLLDPIPAVADMSVVQGEMRTKSQVIDEIFENFNVEAKVTEFHIGPTITTFEVKPGMTTKLTKITGLEDNIKMQLQAKDIRIQAPIPGKSVVGIEIPNTNKKLVTFNEVLKQSQGQEAELLVAAGQDVNGEVMTFDLAKTPHMLVAGSTGSGKSVAINTVLASLLLQYSPREVQLILVDPKMVEFTPYHNIPHLITPVITNATDANLALKEAVNIMEERYKKMAENGARNIKELNVKLQEKGEIKLPYLVVIVDELADLMMVAAKEVEDSIMRITQKARAAGIHMIVATQRPSTDVITGVIKSNIPSRIAFTVASSIDSRTILDQSGAEKLIGMGDMLMSLYGQLPIRGQGAYISSEEVERVTDKTKEYCKPNYKIDVKETIAVPGLNLPAMDDSDPLYQAAKALVTKQRKASTSLIQRYLSVGYNKAANIIDALEANGVIGPSNGSKPREVLISEE